MRPRLLDLGCKAGGAGVGYERAGFQVTGADLVHHKRNPHPVILGDALKLAPRWIAENFDAVHASPRCQGYTALRHAKGARGAEQDIGAFRDLMLATGLPYVIENVEEAAWDMRAPIMLCGSSFGLGAYGYELQRHRMFECNFPIVAPSCAHSGGPVVGVYGGHARCRSAKHGGRGTKDVWPVSHKDTASRALGIDWMTLDEMSEAVPPTYTEFIGGYLMQEVMRRRG